MLLQPLHLLFLSSLSLLLSYSPALAETGSVVVPTVPSGTPTPADTPNTSPINAATRFSCEFYNSQYTVMYQPQSQPGKYFPWAAPSALGGGWTPQRRCDTIASRLELYRPDGLQELRTSTENNENIICVTTEAKPSCRIVLTVPRDKDPITVRNSVFQNLSTADSGQQTTAVNAYTDGDEDGINNLYKLGRSILGGGSSRSPINLKPFLDPQDGGTGSKLRHGVSIGHPTR
jgi:hypothetical protein